MKVDFKICRECPHFFPWEGWLLCNYPKTASLTAIQGFGCDFKTIGMLSSKSGEPMLNTEFEPPNNCPFLLEHMLRNDL